MDSNFEGANMRSTDEYVDSEILGFVIHTQKHPFFQKRCQHTERLVAADRCKKNRANNEMKISLMLISSPKWDDQKGNQIAGAYKNNGTIVHWLIHLTSGLVYQAAALTKTRSTDELKKTRMQIDCSLSYPVRENSY